MARLIDCVEPKVRPDSAVLIKYGRIRAILENRGEMALLGEPDFHAIEARE